MLLEDSSGVGKLKHEIRVKVGLMVSFRGELTDSEVRNRQVLIAGGWVIIVDVEIFAYRIFKNNFFKFDGKFYSFDFKIGANCRNSIMYYYITMPVGIRTHILP